METGLKELEYPFDGELILKKAKSIRRRLMEENSERISKRIAVLGGSTTHEIVKILELFLLNNGIEPIFYESEYAKYWEDVMFNNSELISFKPDLIYVHTSNRNIRVYPQMTDEFSEVQVKLSQEYKHYEDMWIKIEQTFQCPIIQSNFELPYYRLLGNSDSSNFHGRSYFINELNQLFYKYAASHNNFYINDIHYLAADYGLENWGDPFFWHMYKYSLCLPAIPYLA